LSEDVGGACGVSPPAELATANLTSAQQMANAASVRFTDVICLRYLLTRDFWLWGGR